MQNGHSIAGDQQEGNQGWLSPADIAREFGVTTNTVRNWINRGVRMPARPDSLRLRAVLIGKRYAVRRQWMSDFVEALEHSMGVAANGAGGRPEVPVEPVSRQQKRLSREREAFLARSRR